MHASDIFRRLGFWLIALTFGEGLTPATALAAYTKDLMSDSSIAAGYDHSFALHDGAVKGWGADWAGQLGSGLPWAFQRLQPTAVVGLTKVTMIAAGLTHTLVLKKDGTVWAWGTNLFGQLGDGTTRARFAPVQVLGLPPIKAIGAGTDFSFAIGAADGKVYGWGRNDAFQLGLGSKTAAYTPQWITTLRNITKITGGRTHGLAIDSSQRVWAWGRNPYGQVGNGTRGGDQSTPIMLATPTAATHVSAGWEHSLARDAGGSAWAWGRDHKGQLGEGSTSSDSNVPVRLTGLTDVLSIAAGQHHSLAVTSHGIVWAWGFNEFGQLGDNTRTNRFTPIRVSGVHDFVVAIAAGAEHSLAADMHGQLFAWGNNRDGRLGTGAVDYTYPDPPAKAQFKYEYKVLVLMVSNSIQASWPGVEGFMANLTSDIGRMSFGKVVLGVDYAAYVADQTLFDLCAQDPAPVKDETIKQWALDQAYAAGIDLSHYLHFVIQPNDDLRPICSARGNEGGLTNVTSGPVTVSNVGVLKSVSNEFGTNVTFPRMTQAHEFLHGYGSSHVSHNDRLACTVGTTAYLPRSDYSAISNPDCLDGVLNHRFFSPMNAIASGPQRIDEADLRFNENGVYKDWWHWTAPDAVQQVPLPAGTYTYNLFPADDSTAQAGQTYGVRIDVRGPVPANFEQAFFLEYRKQAPQGAVNGAPDFTTRAGVYVYLRERPTLNLTQTPSAFSLRAVKVGQVDDPDFVQGVSTLPAAGVTELETGVTVRLIAIGPSYATVQVQIYP